MILGSSLLAAAPAFAGDDASLDAKVAAIAQRAQPALEALAADKDLVAETAARNAENMSDDASKALQARWIAPAAKDADFRAYLDNKSTRAFQKAMKKSKGLSKLFSMDKLGNVVGTLPRCHDFVHGYQPKFLESYKSGKTIVNKPALDLTSKKYSVQISVPIKDGASTIGVIVGTYGIK
jgi:hypothetical protein